MEEEMVNRITGDTYMTYKRGVGKGWPDISVLVELTVLSQLWEKKGHDKFK